MDRSIDHFIRPLIVSDEPILKHMLYHAIFVPEGKGPPPPDIVLLPELARYYSGWGRPEDMGFAAMDTVVERPVGAVWLRLLTGANAGFGFVDDVTPELAIAVLPDFRSQGLGTKLLGRLIGIASEHFDAVSLSVSQANPAIRLYERYGFETVRTSGDSLVMVKSLGDGSSKR